ncbi:hypothetical protein [Longivirga aurantiaca]|uniref:DUF4386 family protein n=1 Tax=Longivirga aurantiaca TaxID=1837743 RepID=A0ABW1SVU7_9ACTN
MHIDVETSTPPVPTASRRMDAIGRAVSGAGAVLAAAALVVLGERITATDGAGLGAQLVDQAGAIVLAATLAVYAAAALSVAVVRVSRTVRGPAGAVVGHAGCAVAVLLALYYGSFAAGSLVGADLLTTPGAASGEAALVAANMVEFGRYAVGFALVLAVAVAFRRIPRWLSISAFVMVVLAATPVTAWVAAILIPAWLGTAGALVTPVEAR